MTSTPCGRGVMGGRWSAKFKMFNRNSSDHPPFLWYQFSASGEYYLRNFVCFLAAHYDASTVVAQVFRLTCGGMFGEKRGGYHEW